MPVSVARLTAVSLIVAVTMPVVLAANEFAVNAVRLASVATKL